MLEFFIKNLIFFGLTILATILFKLIIAKSKFRKKNSGNILKYPLGYRLAPLSFVGYCGVVTALAFWQGIGAHWQYVVVSGIVAAGGLIVMIVWSIWRVEFDETGFVYTSKAGKKNAYVFEKLELKQNEHGTKWYFYLDGVEVFCLPFYISGGKELLKAYEKIHNQKKDLS